ncbi:MAG: response regulator [Woeseiaceae bacterium]
MVVGRFKNLPITQKLILVMLLTSVTAVLVVSSVFGASEALNYRRNMVDDITTLADVIGTNSNAAITFEDSGLANQVLASLSADDSILSAHMYLENGEQLAAYAVDGSTDAESTTDAREEIERLVGTVAESQLPLERMVGLQFIDAVRPVMFDSELIGVLHLRASLEELVTTLRRIGVMAIATVLFAILVAYLLSFRLQAVISRPILRLSDLMKKVSEDQDYSLRARPSGNDEIGTLMSGFNDMLAQLSLRDVKLAEANDQLKLAVKETIEAKEAAESASSAKSDFLARMSHEIRTPMNGVLGMTDLLLASELKKTERKFAETIRQSGEALLALINDILDFSKIEAGELGIEESDLDLGEVVEGIVDLLYNRAHSQGVELIGAIGPDVCTSVRGDSIRLRQVLMNLVGNAVKFTHHGEIVIELSEQQASDGKSIYRFAVRDTGIGIEPEKLSVVFDRFAQADVSTTREYGGTGLGLAISKQLVELMGGEFGVSSQPGEGSTFWFTLPLIQATSENDDDSLAQLGMHGLRALVVDDNATNREVARQQLVAWGVDVSTAVSANDALSLMRSSAERKEQIDLVLLDFFMPKKDGLELATDIRACPEFGEPRLLMLSSAGSEYDEAAMLDAGIDSYLSKPVRRAVLYEAITDVFSTDQTINTSAQQATTDASPIESNMNLNVLLAEDNPTNMQVARHVLMSLGCRVVEVENGQDALREIRKNTFDLVLMDCQMPIMDGYTATLQQRRLESRMDATRIPIIALTANALPEDRQKCLDAGMDDFVSKPFTRQALAETIAKWCAPKVDAEEQPKPPDTYDVIVTDESILESNALEQISELDPQGDAGLLSSVIGTYVENAKLLMQDLKDSIRNQDADGIIRASHSLKSSSANVGAKQVADLMSLIEQGARKADIDIAKSSIARAETEYERAVVQLLSIQSTVAA